MSIQIKSWAMLKHAFVKQVFRVNCVSKEVPASEEQTYASMEHTIVSECLLLAWLRQASRVCCLLFMQASISKVGSPFLMKDKSLSPADWPADRPADTTMAATSASERVPPSSLDCKRGARTLGKLVIKSLLV